MNIRPLGERNKMTFYRDKDNYPLLNGGWLKSFADKITEAQNTGNLTPQEQGDISALKQYLLKAQANFSSGNYGEALKIIRDGIKQFEGIFVKLSYSSDPIIKEIEKFVTNTELKLKEEKNTPATPEAPSTGNAKQEMNKILQFVKAKNFKGAKNRIDALEAMEWFKDFMSKANAPMKNFYNDILKEVDEGLNLTAPAAPEAAPATETPVAEDTTTSETPATPAPANNLYSSVSEIETIDIVSLKQNLETFKKETGSYGNNYYIKFSKVLKEIEKYLGFLTRTTASSSDKIVTSAPNFFSNMWNKYVSDPAMSQKMNKMNQAENLPQKIHDIYMEFGNLYNKINNLSSYSGINKNQAQAIKYMNSILYPFSAYQETQQTESTGGGASTMAPAPSEGRPSETETSPSRSSAPVAPSTPELSENTLENIKNLKDYLKKVYKDSRIFVREIKRIANDDEGIDKIINKNFEFLQTAIDKLNKTLSGIEMKYENPNEEISATEPTEPTEPTASNIRDIKKKSTINKWKMIKKDKEI